MLRQPVLFVWGDEDVFMRPRQAVEHIAALSHGTLLEIPGTGHAPWLQNLDVVGRAVVNHLAGLPVRVK
jgi:pimeloyl-ACP methyl ester carboxylesterase